MYYPYLRGRQNELLCLRELLENNELGNHITPIIEPVRCSSTFFSTLSKFIEIEKDVIVIRNPKVGNFDTEFEELESQIENSDGRKKDSLRKAVESYNTILKNPYISNAFLIDDKIINDVLSSKIDAQKSVFINTENNFLDKYEDFSNELNSKLTIIPKDEDFKDLIIGNTVMLEDSFNKARRNVDYLDVPDERFNKNHLIYKRRGYNGFSDYSIIGKTYEESGFAPSAIAIHIMYFGKKDELRIHHFVSLTNDEPIDQARKFEEAMQHMLNWTQFSDIPKTKGLLSLIEYYNKGKYPGLGVIKKYSLMHHIEIINNYLEG